MVVPKGGDIKAPQWYDRCGIIFSINLILKKQYFESENEFRGNRNRCCRG